MSTKARWSRIAGRAPCLSRGMMVPLDLKTNQVHSRLKWKGATYLQENKALAKHLVKL
jgi:hypothetical protein